MESSRKRPFDQVGGEDAAASAPADAQTSWHIATELDDAALEREVRPVDRALLRSVIGVASTFVENVGYLSTAYARRIDPVVRVIVKNLIDTQGCYAITLSYPPNTFISLSNLNMLRGIALHHTHEQINVLYDKDSERMLVEVAVQPFDKPRPFTKQEFISISYETRDVPTQRTSFGIPSLFGSKK